MVFKFSFLECLTEARHEKKSYSWYNIIYIT